MESLLCLKLCLLNELWSFVSYWHDVQLNLLPIVGNIDAFFLILIGLTLVSRAR